MKTGSGIICRVGITIIMMMITLVLVMVSLIVMSTIGGIISIVTATAKK